MVTCQSSPPTLYPWAPRPEFTRGPILSSFSTYNGVWDIYPPCGPGSPELALPLYPVVCGAQESELNSGSSAGIPDCALSSPPDAGFRGFSQSNAHSVVPWNLQCSQTSHVPARPVALALRGHGTPLFPHVLRPTNGSRGWLHPTDMENLC